MAEKEESKEISEDKQDELLEQFKTDLAESKTFMKPIQQRMDNDYALYRNNSNNSLGNDVNFKVSDFFEYVETVVPIVTNNRIRASVHSDYMDYVAHARGMNEILDHTYDVNNWDYKSQELFRMAMIYRSGLVYSGYDSKYKNGTGKLCLDVCNSRWAWFDPNPTELEDSRFFIYAIPMRKTQVVAMYPKKKQEINDSIQKNTNNDPTTKQANGQAGWFKTWLGTIKNYLIFNNSNQAKTADHPFSTSTELEEQQKHKNVVAYIEYWYRDDNDKWRKSCWADDVLLKDEPNPFWHGKLPYDVLSPVKDPMSVLGVPISEQIENITNIGNMLMNFTLDNSRLHAKPPLLYNTSIGNVRDPQKLKELADEGVIPITNPDFVPMSAIADYMQVPVLPGYVTNMFEHLQNIKDRITGVNDSFRGVQQASSGKEVQLQQEAAYTRIKTMIDQFEKLNKNVAEKVIVNAMQFYRQTREFRIKGDYTKYNQEQEAAQQNGQTMPFDIEKVQKGIDENGEPTYDRTVFFMYANPNEWTKLDKEDEENEEEASENGEIGENDYEKGRDRKSTSGETTTDGEGERDNEQSREGRRQTTDEQKDGSEEQRTVLKAFKVLQFTVEIEAGSSLPQSRLARREEANSLFQLGVIDQESILDTYDWPDRDEVIKRMKEQQAQAQEAQVQAAQAEEQAKQQTEQMKIQSQMEIERMKIEADAAKTAATNQASLEKQQMSNRGQVANTAVENNADNGLAGQLDEIRRQNPQAANMSDDELIAALTGEQSQQGQLGLAEMIDQIRQQNPGSEGLSDDEIIAALTQ